MPTFSIVIPTRNRAHLLQTALLSALLQSFDDYEIVISDNCSSDDTQDIVRQLSCPRVKYFCTDKPLPMHENWEFALSKTRGEWITFLTDRSMASSSLLEKITEAVGIRTGSVVGWNHASYGLPSWHEERLWNRLVLPRFTGRTMTRDSRKQLAKLLRLKPGHVHLPRMLNSACHVDLIRDIIRRAGCFFLPPAPDYSSCAAMLSSTIEYKYIDQPLLISLLCKESTGNAARHGRGAPTTDFFRLLEGGSDPRFVPLSIAIVPSAVAESVLTTQQAMPERFEGLHLDPKQYFAQCYGELLQLSATGIDTEQEKSELFLSLDTEPLSTQLEIIPHLLTTWAATPIRRKLRSLAFRFPSLAPLAGYRIIHGATEGFTGPLGALHYVERLLCEGGAEGQRRIWD